MSDSLDNVKAMQLDSRFKFDDNNFHSCVMKRLSGGGSGTFPSLPGIKLARRLSVSSASCVRPGDSILELDIVSTVRRLTRQLLSRTSHLKPVKFGEVCEKMEENGGTDNSPPAFCCPIGLDIMSDPVFLIAVNLSLHSGWGEREGTIITRTTRT